MNLEGYKNKKECQQEKNEESEKPSYEKSENKQKIKDSLEITSESGILKVYNKSGKFVFNGNPEQLLIFWKNNDYGKTEDIGGICDEDGKSIFRFGVNDKYGFTDRKKINQIFKHLEESITRKRCNASDHQKIIDIRQSLIPETLNLNNKENEKYFEKQLENTQENLIEQKNIFNDEKAEKITEITKNWLKFGGNFYDHLTGKNLELEKGVDYKINPDGTINMPSFIEARKKKIDHWLKDPSNQKWIADGPDFQKKHINELSYGQEVVKARQSDGTFMDKSRYTTPYFYENNWLYYESNYFDKIIGELKQPEREETKYRIYFNCTGENVFPLYQGIIEELNQDPDLQKFGFQIKTADVSRIDLQEISQIINQKDRIVLYIGENGIKKAIPILQKYSEKNRQIFNEDGILLAQHLVDKQGNQIPGIKITSETKGYSPDPTDPNKRYASFNDMQSKIIESCFRSIATGLKNNKTMELISEKYPKMKESLLKLATNASAEDYIKAILSDPNGSEFLTKNLKIIYPQWSKAFGMSEKNIAFKENYF